MLTATSLPFSTPTIYSDQFVAMHTPEAHNQPLFVQDGQTLVGVFGEPTASVRTVRIPWESLQASLGSFEQGQSDYLDLLDTQRTLLEFQLANERALVDRATSAARIEQLVGVPLNELDDTSRTEGETP